MSGCYELPIEFKLRLMNSAKDFVFGDRYRGWFLTRFGPTPDDHFVMRIIPSVRHPGLIKDPMEMMIDREAGVIIVDRDQVDRAVWGGAPAMCNLVRNLILGAVNRARHECLN